MKLLTPDQVAEKLQVSKKQIYHLTSCKLIPHRKLGRLLRFSEDDIDAWVNQMDVKLMKI